jgi:glyoxylase-like metal-dependent hydrolase (beta-lactamase superfamily II)
MKRMAVLAALVATGALTVSVAARQQPAGRGQQAARVVEVQKIRDNLFVLAGAGGGGNTAVFIQSAGVTVIDTKNPGWGAPILSAIRELTPKPVTTIVNTHTHGDHVSGNVEFPATVDVVTHANTRANMQRMMPASGIAQSGPSRNIFAENDGRGLPNRTFTDRMTLGSGADQIDLRYFGRGHTNGDAWVFFPALRAVHSGDIFPGRQLPIMDSNNGGSAVEYAGTLMKAHGAMAGVESIITGHGPVMTPGDLREFAEFNRDFVAAAREAKRAGRSVDETAAGWIVPPKYSGYAAPQPVRVRANVELAFRELP